MWAHEHEAGKSKEVKVLPTTVREDVGSAGKEKASVGSTTSNGRGRIRGVPQMQLHATGVRAGSHPAPSYKDNNAGYNAGRARLLSGVNNARYASFSRR
jgi:hypothetical protein